LGNRKREGLLSTITEPALSLSRGRLSLHSRAMNLLKILLRPALALLLAGQASVWAQSSTRLLLASGSGVPGHAGFVFGPFSNLAMNEDREVVFLSTLRSPRNEIRAVVRSSGVSFSVVAFQGLRAPVAKTTYVSFSAPSINTAGSVAFTATLKDNEEASSLAVIRVDGTNARVVASTGDSVPGNSQDKFQDFSAPLINAEGNILFGARWEGQKPGTGLFLWTLTGLQALERPEGLRLPSKTVLEPMFFSHDEAVFMARESSTEAALDQFFRAVATRGFQDLQPPPNPSETVQVLAPKAGGPLVKMVLVLMEGGNVQTALLPGDPSAPVVAKRLPNVPPPSPLGQIEGQTTGAQGDIIFAATRADLPSDLALYCYCSGQVNRLTSPEDFLPITQAAPGKPLLSLVGDSQQTAAFIAAGAGGEASAIYVTSLP
jgi:hypothetical protein